MDFIDFVSSEQLAKMHSFTVRTTEQGPVFRAHYPATRRSGSPAVKYVELLIDTKHSAPARWRWRCGYLYNERAIFWDVPPQNKNLWEDFARRVADAVHAETLLRSTELNKALFALGN